MTSSALRTWSNISAASVRGRAIGVRWRRATRAWRCSWTERRGDRSRDPVRGGGPLCCQLLLQALDVLQQPLAGQHQEVIAELRILEVDLEQPVVGDRQHLAVLDAFDRSGAPVVRREEAEFAHERSGQDLDVDLLDQEL